MLHEQELSPYFLFAVADVEMQRRVIVVPTFFRLQLQIDM